MERTRDLIRKNLKRLREQRGVPARHIARLLDVETNHIYRIEKGNSALMPEHMDKICQEFNIEPEYFLQTHDSPDDTPSEAIPPEIYNELIRVKDLSPEARRSVIDFIKFQIEKMETKEGRAE